MKENYVFGERVKELRERRKLSQEDLGEKVGITGSAIGSYETGVAKPRVDVLESLAVYFNVSADFLLGIEKRRTFVLDDFYEDKQDTLSQILELIKNDLQK